MYPEQALFAGCGGELNCPECSKAERNKGIEAYGNVKSITEEWDEKHAGLLLYFETCLVDSYGRVDGRRINKEEVDVAQKWTNEDFVKFGRLSMKTIDSSRGDAHRYTHYIRFSNEAWEITHQLRRERSGRMLRHHIKMLEDEFA